MTYFMCKNFIFLRYAKINSFSRSVHNVTRHFGCISIDTQKPNRINVYQERRRTFSVDAYRGWFQRITESDVVTSTKDLLITIHDATGLPWCSCIVLTTLGLRLLVTFPLGIYQTYVISKVELCKLEFNLLIQELKRETAVAIKKFGWTEKEARRAYNSSVKKHWRLLIERENCHPFKASVVLWIQLPGWILLSLALRSMAYKMGSDPIVSEIISGQLSTEGCLWIPNLLEVDPTGILPVLVCASNLAIIELQSCSRTQHTRTQTVLTNVFRGFALISFPIALTVPSCMSLYWSASSILALIQNLALMSPSLRSAVGIPKTPSNKEKPYQHVWLNFKEKWRIFKS